MASEKPEEAATRAETAANNAASSAQAAKDAEKNAASIAKGVAARIAAKVADAAKTAADEEGASSGENGDLGAPQPKKVTWGLTWAWLILLVLITVAIMANQWIPHRRRIELAPRFFWILLIVSLIVVGIVAAELDSIRRHRGEQQRDTTKNPLKKDQLSLQDRLKHQWQHGLNEDKNFNDRLTFFLAFEAFLIAGVLNLFKDRSEPASGALTIWISILGIGISLIWMYIQIRQAFLLEILRLEIVEFDSTFKQTVLERERGLFGRIDAVFLFSHIIPAIIIAMWLVIIHFVPPPTGAVDTTSQTSASPTTTQVNKPTSIPKSQGQSYTLPSVANPNTPANQPLPKGNQSPRRDAPASNPSAGRAGARR